MIRKRLIWIGLSVYMTSLACQAPPIRVLSPTSARPLTHMPVDLLFDFAPAADLGTLVVVLNGTDITADLGLHEPAKGRASAEALGFFDPALLLDGVNQIEIDIEIGGSPHQRVHDFTLEGDPYADAVVSFSPGAGAGYGVAGDALGGPRGGGVFQGGLAVVSLGIGGTIELEFVDNAVVDEPGVDLTVFENAFLDLGAGLVSDPPFSEPGRVWVSQDGESWVAFGCALDAEDAPYHPGCAGVYPVLASVDEPAGPHATEPSDVPIEDLVGQPVIGFPTPPGSGGDSFDLADVGLAWARFVRIEAAPFETPPSGPDNAGFDLDAVAAVHSRPFTDDDGNGVPDWAE